MTRRGPRLLGISDFSDDIIAEVFKFLGRGHFLFVAGTSRQFHRVYETLCRNENDSAAATTITSAVESISRLQWARANGCPWNRRTCSCGMHDIHRLCGDTWKKDRTTYLEKDERDKSCFDLYKIALKQLADQVARFPAHLKIFQTTTAAWPKYGNVGVSWSPSRPQKLPLDSGFIDGFNALAFDVLEGYGDSISIVDGYWISLPRPDNRETDINSETGKKLSHPGVEVLGAMQRIWNTLILLAFCDAQ